MKPLNLWARLRNRYQRFAAIHLGRRVFRLSKRFPVISFTFDDFPQSALHIGGRILEQYGAAGTYYASIGLMNKHSPVGQIFSPEDLAELIARGHELGCHTFGHCNAWDTKPRAFEESIIENRRALSQLLPGAVFKTMSYPITAPRPQTKRRAGKHFFCCRAGGQTFNVGTTDLNCLLAFFLEQSRDCPALVKEMIDRNCQEAGWLVFATHDVCEQPTRFGCTPEFFEDIVQYAALSGARILPVGKAYELIRESHKSSKVPEAALRPAAESGRSPSPQSSFWVPRAY